MLLIINPDAINAIEELEDGKVFISLSIDKYHTCQLILDYPFFKDLVENMETLLKAMMIARDESRKEEKTNGV